MLLVASLLIVSIAEILNLSQLFFDKYWLILHWRYFWWAWLLLGSEGGCCYLWLLSCVVMEQWVCIYGRWIKLRFGCRSVVALGKTILRTNVLNFGRRTIGCMAVLILVLIHLNKAELWVLSLLTLLFFLDPHPSLYFFECLFYFCVQYELIFLIVLELGAIMVHWAQGRMRWPYRSGRGHDSPFSLFFLDSW